jgi:hypothetical protein
MDQPQSTSTSRRPRALTVALAIAAGGAALLLIGVLGTVGEVAGLAAVIVGTVLAAPYSEQPGTPVASWWTILAAGALIALAGAPIGLAVESLGGLLTVLGGVLVAVAVALGYPGGR